MLHITGRTEPTLRQKTVFCFTLILLTGNSLSTNYQNSPNHPYVYDGINFYPENVYDIDLSFSKSEGTTSEPVRLFSSNQ